ncbi:anti-sigma factor [Azorhizobium doebereinerae]|uniref:anti-sigma factor n=1 Tax=Azorhizobium doebereinerae TaxID=281091 RepID=UPI00042691F8|nr:anti-sigma factor [Azorhizobium doebereinerae]
MTVNEDDRQFVAEYVLGTLPAALRLMMRSRIAEEPEVAAVARLWEQRLAPLHELAVSIAPPDDLWADLAGSLSPPPVAPPEPSAAPADGTPAGDTAFAIPASVDADEAAPTLAAPLEGMPGSARRWRWVALGLGVALVGLAGGFAYREWGRTGGPYYLASLQEARAASVLVRIDARDGGLLVRPLLDPAPEGKTYQLWLVPDGQPPRSLGVFNSAFATRSDAVRRLGVKGAAKAMLQVTVEPEGGSDTVPSGEVLYSGRLMPE